MAADLMNWPRSAVLCCRAATGLESNTVRLRVYAVARQAV